MKKAIPAAALAAITVTALLAGCSGNSVDITQTGAPSAVTATGAELWTEAPTEPFDPPAEQYTVGADGEEPDPEKVGISYDQSGRVSRVEYTDADGAEIVQGYTYEEDARCIIIITVKNNQVIDQKVIDFDDAEGEGLLSVDGYYVTGE